MFGGRIRMSEECKNEMFLKNRQEDWDAGDVRTNLS